mgnify:CR=1 FL=1
MDELERKLQSIRNSPFVPKSTWNYCHHVATDEQLCAKIAQLLDVDTYGECDPVKYVQQALLDAVQDLSIENLEARLKILKGDS